ncbi:MAG: hypothetical protein A2408_01900 [Candidatus Yonathbacteria bacterium RIFOXYC1_FULL_52_10]|uniref:Uncharacterized protein n=1 Tax=Candidatus Yonathbacteria bacterium RIFOXYD1_FULL_52_36 TaxID=1802730 RepID=A0A1G2SJV4_9BACT|nr:MAG: hypothetical protein A2408_01900 [Candidatus Yonathbacteria bacterium RIFOXYC1_FULL_52_10]OHA85306.1 MAG: hypothetical protein A2591_04025 [Candidatus Yonathbacteria bacterium RIFOXYD1_FULL_52_36]
MDTTENEVQSARKKKIRASAAFLLVATVLVGVVVMRNEQMPPDPKGVLTDKEVLKKSQYLAGFVESITAEGDTGTLVVRANIKDISSGSLRYIEPEDVQFIEKVYMVSFDENTVFSGKVVADIVSGDQVAINTKELIYEKDSLTALSIAFFDPREDTVAQILRDRRTLDAVVESVENQDEDTVIVVRTAIPDEDKLRTMDLSGSYTVPFIERKYSVRISKSTTLEGVAREEISSGMSAIIVLDQDVNAPGVSEFGAITFESQS